MNFCQCQVVAHYQLFLSAEGIRLRRCELADWLTGLWSVAFGLITRRFIVASPPTAQPPGGPPVCLSACFGLYMSASVRVTAALMRDERDGLYAAGGAALACPRHVVYWCFLCVTRRARLSLSLSASLCVACMYLHCVLQWSNRECDASLIIRYNARLKTCSQQLLASVHADIGECECGPGFRAVKRLIF